MDSHTSLAKANIYERWYQKRGKAKVAEAQKIKNERMQKLKLKPPTESTGVGKKSKNWDLFLSGLKNAKKSFKHEKDQNITQKGGADPEDHKNLPRAKTQYNQLQKQKMFHNKTTRDVQNWMVGGDVQEAQEQNKFLKYSDTSTIYSNQGKWAEGGSWPSHFSSNSFEVTHRRIGGKAQEPAVKEDCLEEIRSKKSLYERWFQTHKTAISEAQLKVKELKKGSLIPSIGTSRWNASKLREIFQSNHQDEDQDVIQGKKLTYHWILEQEGLIDKRLDNVAIGLPAEEVEHETWKYADFINAVYPWEKTFEVEYGDCS